MSDRKWRRLLVAAAWLAAPALAQEALAQEKGVLDPQPLPPLANPSDPRTPAKELFGRAQDGAPLEPAPVGFYSRGCLAGGEELPINGSNWQVMRLSRNRNWGHPTLIAFIERFARAAARTSGWPGVLVGDMSQPRGGPMLSGHASHQIGLDADFWLTPMPPRELSRVEREEMSALDMVREDGLDVIPERWTASHLAVVRAAAQDPAVQRIFVNAAIKRAMCRVAAGEPWMRKVRPYFGHNYHFHVRLFCPRGAESCRDQDPTPTGDGCDASLAWWFTDEALRPRKSTKTWPPMTMSALPEECREVLRAR
jgi:penicillin-insensitive murein endopeptidase